MVNPTLRALARETFQSLFLLTIAGASMGLYLGVALILISVAR